MHRAPRPLPLVLLLVVALLALVVPAPGASAAGHERPSAGTRHEPRLHVSVARARAATTCHGSLRTSRVEPVLFLHGTTSNSRSDWSWNWNRAFRQRHWAYCDLDLPQSGNGDIQTSAEYVVRAIRAEHARAGRAIALVGHSQGGMIGRWALRYWPDTRALVADYVGLSSSNHGTTVFNAQCASPAGCTAANWQQSRGSHFLRALNAGRQVYRGIDYTEVATREDEVVVPYTSPYLPRGRHVTDVAVQQLCPTESVDHFGMSYDNAAWLIGLDALTHRGPARLARVSTATCGRPTMPGVDPATFAQHVAAALAQTASSSAAAPQLTREPRLRRYAR